MPDIDVPNLLACPAPHRAPVVRDGEAWGCSDVNCEYAIQAGGFPIFRGVPVLIDFAGDTLCRREAYVDTKSGSDVYITRRPESVKKRLQRITGGTSSVTLANCRRFIAEVGKISPSPRILVIGSGERGQGTDMLWENDGITRIGIDIYPSHTTDFVADAHELPFRDQSFDGVWIQAVLEHVAEPQRVVAEIERVLKLDGIVYAETPFMQQVHEGAYDFQRFTVTGHRFLFRRFDALAMGGNKGPGVVLAWAIRYFFWGLFRSRKAATLISYPLLVLLRMLDRFMDPRALWDGPSGTYFLGRKNEGPAMPQRDLPALYQGFQR
ncbi:class I SAM-dependent methyltransferase [Sphingopyxis fribergensis]